MLNNISIQHSADGKHMVINVTAQVENLQNPVFIFLGKASTDIFVNEIYF